MVIDTSAIVAMLMNEASANRLVGEDQVVLARDAALRFGRGRHPAALNFGDLFSYALAAARDEPLLFVGDDFAKTDVAVAEW